MKHAYKFGVVYMKENQQTEEELFGNETHSKAFDDFLDLLGERVRLRGFDKYRAGLDSNNDLTGTHSVYTKFHDKEVMFHVSTLLPFEEFDVQKVQLLLGLKQFVCVKVAEDIILTFEQTVFEKHDLILQAVFFVLKFILFILKTCFLCLHFLAGCFQTFFLTFFMCASILP